MGIDAGSSGCKVVAIDGKQRVVASSRRGYGVVRGFDGSVVADVNSWTEMVQEATRDCLGKIDAPIAAVAVTAPAHHIVILDNTGNPLAPMLTAGDRRPAPIAAELEGRYGSSLFESTWVRLVPGCSHAQLAWLARRDPELLGRARWVLPFKDYLRGLLTGDRFTDRSDAAGTGLWSQRDQSWEWDLAHDLGLSRDALPEVREALELAGKVSENASRLWGIPAKTPVAVGATDTAAELLSLPTTTDVQLIKLATTGTVVTVTRRPSPTPTILTYPHARPDEWYQLGVINNAASAADTVAALIGAQSEDIFSLHLAARAIQPGSEGLLFLPFLDGERTPYYDPHLRAAFLGLTGAHRREHLFRATLEGVAFSLAVAANHLENLGLWKRFPSFITGGGARSQLWSTIVASVFDQELLQAINAGPATGSAWIARISAGAARSSDAPSIECTSVHPDEFWAREYHWLQPIYREAIASTKKVSRLLDHFVERSPE